MAEEKPKKRNKGWDNVIPLGGADDERAQAIRRKGIAAVHEKMKRRRVLKDIMDEILAATATSATKEEIDTIAVDIVSQHNDRTKNDPQTDVYTAMAAAMVAKAMRGDVDAARWVRDSAGDKPTEKTQIEANVVTPADVEMMKAVSARLGLDAKKSKENG